MNSTLKRNTKEFLNNPIYSKAEHSHQEYFINQTSDSLEAGLRMMIDGMEMYCLAYQRLDNSPVGEDQFIGEQIKDIAQSLSYLLSGPGIFSGSTVSVTINDIMNKAGIKY